MTREIQLSNGGVTLVDDEDYPVLSRHNWYINFSGKRGYAITKLKTDQTTIWRCIFMHHMILGTSGICDHIDGDPLNNQKSNLRKATHQTNGWNKGAPNRKDKKSRFKGVRQSTSKKHPNRWQAYLKAVEPGAHKSTGKMIYSVFYDSEEDAARAYNEMARKVRGEWTWFNPVEPRFPISARSKGGQ